VSDPSAGVSGSDLDDAGPPGRLWDRMKADPQYAPEHLALEAIRRLGPQAQAWVQRTRARQPDLGPEALARLAVRRFTAHARLSGAVSGAAGLPGAVVDVGVLAWTQARMVLHVAAAYGVDPTHPDRAVDLLVLQRVHRIAETARRGGRPGTRQRPVRVGRPPDRPVGVPPHGEAGPDGGRPGDPPYRGEDHPRGRCRAGYLGELRGHHRAGPPRHRPVPPAFAALLTARRAAGGCSDPAAARRI
jgi:hypothetical protein